MVASREVPSGASRLPAGACRTQTGGPAPLGAFVVRQLAAQALAQRVMAHLDSAMTRALQAEPPKPNREATD